MHSSLLSVCALASFACALADFSGYMHLPGRNFSTSESYTRYSTPWGGVLSIESAKSLCDQDDECFAFWVGTTVGNTLYRVPPADGVDTYISNSTCGTGPASIVSGSCGATSITSYLQCPLADWAYGQPKFLAAFDLPPNLIESACSSRDDCLGFTITSDLAHGVLWGSTGNAFSLYVKLPKLD